MRYSYLTVVCVLFAQTLVDVTSPARGVATGSCRREERAETLSACISFGTILFSSFYLRMPARSRSRPYIA